MSKALSIRNYSNSHNFCLRAFVPIPAGFDSKTVFAKASDVQSIENDKKELEASGSVSRSALRHDLETPTYKTWGELCDKSVRALIAMEPDAVARGEVNAGRTLRKIGIAA